MRPFHILYNKILDWSSSRFAIFWLFLISFLESIILPYPIQDLLLASMSLKHKSKAFYFATICTISSVMGAIVAYYIGLYALELIEPILDKMGYMPEKVEMAILFNKYKYWIILAACFPPLPYKLFTISAGMMSVPIFPFIIVSVFGRGARYFLISYLVRKFGKKTDAWLNKYIDRLGYLIIIIVALGIWYVY